MVQKGDYNFGVYSAGIYNQGFDPLLFELKFDFFYPIELTWSTQILTKEDGSEQRMRLMPRSLKKIEAQEFGIDSLRKADIEDFFDFTKATTNTFIFTDPVTTTSGVLRFNEPELIFDKLTGNIWNWQVALQEVIE